MRCSDFIRQRPAANFHHAIRLASYLGTELNLFVSINFTLTNCEPDKTTIAFRKVRTAFGKWVTRPRACEQEYKVAPTFVWVIENADGCLNAHWLVYVPECRHTDFTTRLPAWIESAAGDIHHARAIHIQSAKTPTAAGKYMLKGMHPMLARNFGIEHVYQGWVTGKRIGTSKNLGATQRRRWIRLGKYPPPKQWVPFKYAQYAKAS